MDPRKLVSAVLQNDDLTARQFVKDAKRAAFSWGHAPELVFATQRERAVYAGLVELLADRNGETPPDWARRVGQAPESVFLMGANSPVWQRVYQARAPASLKAHNVFADSDYLDVAV
jgi:hypothetical protein